MKSESIVSVLGVLLGLAIVAGASSIACNHEFKTVCRQKDGPCSGIVADQKIQGTVKFEGELNTIEGGRPGYTASSWETTDDNCSFVCEGILNGRMVEGDGQGGAYHIRKKANAQPCS